MSSEPWCPSISFSLAGNGVMSSSSIFDHGAAFEEYFRVAFLR